jgi:hypothetical protein
VTAPFEIEIEEDRPIPIERSHLMTGRCRCGAVALAAPGRRLRCGTCIRADAETAVAPPPLEDLAKLGQGYPPTPPQSGGPFPVPEVTSRDCWDRTDAPAVVTKLAEKARKAGWRVKAQRSRGCFPNAATGRPSAPRDLFAIILGNGRHSAYAVRDGDTWSSVMLWGHDRTWFSLASVTDLEQYLTAGGEMSDEWFAEIRARGARAAQRKIDRAKCDKGLHLTKFRHTEPLGPVRGMWCELCGNTWPMGADPWVKPKKARSEGL